MTQAIDPTVAALQESVRHNEKNIDRLDRHLQSFRAEIKREMDDRFNKIDDRFSKVDDRFEKLEKKVDDRFAQMKQDMDDRFNKVDDRFESLENKLDSSLKQVNTTLFMLSGFILSGIGILVAAIKGVF